MADDVIVLGTRPGFYEVLSDRTTAPQNEELHLVLPHDFHGRVRPQWPCLLFVSLAILAD